MASVEELLFAYLTSAPGMQSTIGDRMYPQQLKQGAVMPAIAYHRIDAPRQHTHDDAPSVKTLVRIRIQFDCWGADDDSAGIAGPDQARNVANELMKKLNGYRSAGPPRIDAVLVDGDRDGFDEVPNRFRRIVDVIVWAEEGG